MRTRQNIDYDKEIGKKYNYLTVIDYFRKNGRYYYKCKCKCGNIKDIMALFVRKGETKSCGCYKLEVDIERAKKMGLANRKYENRCKECGKKQHYAKGYCRNCYTRNIRKEKHND